MIILEDILSQEIIQRLGWTLLHFIWQAAVVALLLAILLRLLRKSAANLRYIIACLALVLIVLLPVITIKLVPVSVPHLSTYIEPAPAPVVLSIEEMPPAETTIVEEPEQLESVAPISADSWKQRTIETLEPALPYIVSGWLLGVFGLSVWHLGGWTQLQRLRRRMVKQVNDTLGSKLKVLAERLRVKQTVQLMESALVQIPTVVGWLRPVILLPASALTGLTSEQLEAILAHELAHIKRYDYLINILQTVVEILGFYHPAVWWVSHKIRAERENCCDDLAVAVSGDRVCYARALTSMEEIRAGRGQLAVAATGGNLLGRIRRLVGKDTAEKNSFSWVPAATVILLIIALAIPATITLTARAQGKPEGLGGAVIKGIRANRDKFECGYLAWSSKHINNRFADSDRPATELAGQYELWWDGKKIATKYVRDQVYKDPEGNFRVEEQQGGTSYDGGVLSWKPDFHSDNWLGPEVTRWRGLGSQDWLIQQGSKQEGISNDWSVADNNGVKLIRVMTRNMNEKSIDYEAYSIRDYDPSKGYGLVNEEWYNPNGSPRLKHTVKMLEVISGGWFPVEVDFKSFTITDGRVYTHQHYALDVERCSFNDKSALPDRVFKGAVDKQLKYQQKLQKYLAMELRGISDVKEAAKADRVKRGAREAIEKFVAAAMAGDLEKAGEYAHPDRLPANQIADITEIAKGQNLWIMAVVADDFSAIAVSSVIQGDHNRIGPLVFFLDRVALDGRDNWWVHDIDMETPDGAEGELKRFLEKHPEAEKIPSEKKTDVQVEGEEDFSIMNYDGFEAKTVSLSVVDEDLRVSLFDIESELVYAIKMDRGSFYTVEEEPSYRRAQAISRGPGDVLLQGSSEVIAINSSRIATMPFKSFSEVVGTPLKKLVAHVRFIDQSKRVSPFPAPGSRPEVLTPGQIAVIVTEQGTVAALQGGYLDPNSGKRALKYIILGNVDINNLPEPKQLEGFDVHVGVITDKPPKVLDLDTGHIRQLLKGEDWPEEYDVGWDNDGGGAFFSNRRGSVRMLPISEATSFAEALAIAPKKIDQLSATQKRGVLAKESKYILVRTSEAKIAVLEIKQYDESRAKVRWRIIEEVRQKPDVQVESDRSGESQQEKEPSVDDIPTVLPTIAKSPTPSAEDKAHVQVDCLIVEVSLDLKMDRETTIQAENLLGNKISLRDIKVDVLLRKAAGATAATKDKSAENKRVTQDQFKALVEMLASRGYLRILMHPTLEVVDGKTAKISSSQHVPLQKVTNYIYVGGEHIAQTHTEYKDVTDSLEITPHVFADGHIILQVEAAISSQFIPQGKEQTPIISRREVSTRVRISPGESMIIGGTKRTEKSTKPNSNVKDTKEQATEVLFILTPTIITPATDSQEKTDMQIKGKPDKTSGKLAANRAFFTLPIARIINSAVERKDCFIDFDNDKLYSQPSDFHSRAREKLGISETAILIETRLLSVSEDFLKDVGLDANSISTSNAWSEHLIADSAADPNSETYSLILDDLHVRFLLKAVQAHHDSKALVAPRVLTREGMTAEIAIMTEVLPVLDYNEPNDASDEPQPKIDYVEIGTRIWLKPELTPDNENVRLDFKLEIRQLLGFEERKYKGKYKYIVPRTEVVSTQTQLLVPDGKTLFIGGLKIIEQVESQSSVPILSKLPLIGKAFRSRSIIKDHKMLLILVKPIISPQQKASKILPGQEDSEEHIKSLARQLEKKLNPPAD